MNEQRFGGSSVPESSQIGEFFMLKLVFYVPTSYAEPVKKAVFEAGAGQLGRYEACCWQVLGKGQFKPLKGSQPFIGEEDVVESVDEYRVEMLCAETHIHTAVQALKASHPYEHPAFDVVALYDL